MKALQRSHGGKLFAAMALSLLFSTCSPQPSARQSASRCEPMRIVCLAFDALEMVAALGCHEQVVGRPKGSNRFVFPNAVDVGDFATPDIDSVLRQQPDLVIASSDIQAKATQALVTNHRTVLALNMYTLSDISRHLRMLGRILGRPEAGLAQAEEMERQIEMLRSQIKRGGNRMKVHFEEYGNPVIAGGEWISEMIELAGGVDVHADISRNRKASDRMVSRERINRTDPDVIIAAWCGHPFDRARILSRDGWNNVKAIREGQVYTIPPELVLQPTPRVLEGIARIRDILRSAAQRTPQKN